LCKDFAKEVKYVLSKHIIYTLAVANVEVICKDVLPKHLYVRLLFIFVL